MKYKRADELLHSAVQHVFEHGLRELSLRALADALGTSHRMLIHYFGSKDKLWIEIVRGVERRQRNRLAELLPDPTQPTSEALWAWWKHISDPKLWPSERLFFELYGQALQGRLPAETDFLDDIVDAWVQPIAEMMIVNGLSQSFAYAHGRLGVAVTRGLLLDLLATGETDRVDEAMQAFIDLYEVRASKSKLPYSSEDK